MADAQATHHHTVKETLTSIMIAFIMAFVFRGFVIEGFVIPTGSMAPTLLGKHIAFRGPDTGYDWTTGPWEYHNGNPDLPKRDQGAVSPHDPMAGTQTTSADSRLRAGDRIFVLKYLYSVFDPSRWDVVVFKNPGTQQNYIKRLVGLPGEQIALVDGDVFYRKATHETRTTGLAAWEAGDWSIARKSERIQRAMLQPISDSSFTPLGGSLSFRPRWAGDGWTGLRDSTSYRFEGSDAASLRWTDARPIDDFYPYNETSNWHHAGMQRFPVSDVSMSLGVEPDQPGANATAILDARGMQFRARVHHVNGVPHASLERRNDTGADTLWNEVDTATLSSGLETGRVTNIEFWHIDQALWLFVNDKLVCGGPEDGAYEFTPAQRADAATGRSLAGMLETSRQDVDGTRQGGVLANPAIYRRPALRWEFQGGPLTLHRVRVQRDIHYQVSANGKPTRGGSPNFFPTLGPNDLFVCGDNSPSSLDARLWTAENDLDPWIDDQIGDSDYHVGTVHRDLLIGKAFVVYFPAPTAAKGVPIPDAGHVRWIW